MHIVSVTRPARLGAAVSALALLTGCSEPLDFDLRGNLGAFSTADAARSVSTADRPAPDNRGIISYPQYQVAVARRGDTVNDVAARIGLPAGDLARFNGMEPEGKLREGEILALPRRVAEPSAATGVDIAALAGSAIDSAPDTSPVQTTTLPAAPRPPAPQSQPEPVRHKVVRGETAYTVSRLYQVPVKALAEWNGLGSDFAIREGQYLLIPITDQPPRGVPETTTTAPGQGSPTPTPPSATAPLPDERIDPTPPEPPAVSVGQPSHTSAARMAMPVKGKIIRTYSKGRNDGIDIAGSPGAAIAAAAEGTVRAVTADADKVPIVVVDHGDNLLTVYANLDAIAVKKGDRLKRGQTLAKLRAGDKAYVHFEVRKGFDSVDPMPYLQ
ncbi:MAG: peptidoglycan DD-metalloendopeptidase family protein [Jhaorihella sp.]